MRLLITNNALAIAGGTETWCYTMAREMTRRGFDVDVWSPITAEFCRSHFERGGVRLLHGIPQRGAYDLALANHTTTIRTAQDAAECVIYTSHGISDDVETPPASLHDGPYVAVSEEVFEVQYAPKRLGAMVIYNAVDLELFRPDPDVRRDRITCLCKGDEARGMVVEACTDPSIRCQVEVFDFQRRPRWSDEVAESMRRSFAVVGCGRAAVEGLASGCSVFVFDSRCGGPPISDGWICEGNVDDLRKANFSCRTHGIKVGSVRDLVFYLNSCLRVPSPWASDWAYRRADIRCAAADYISLYEQATART